MCKVSVLFKPYWSGVNNALQEVGFYEYSFLEFMSIRPTNLKYKKVRIRGVKPEQLFELYRYIRLEYMKTNNIFVIVTNIENLFEDEEKEELLKDGIYFLKK